jgi:BirA family biotin operon repressor/biotin-[acetyl-CoA-carboxylase] ligase
MVSLDDFLETFTPKNLWHVVEYETVDSTQEEVKRLIQAGSIFNRTAVIAKIQTLGRGRLDRKWNSMDGNLHFTGLISGFEGVQYLPILTAISVHFALKKLSIKIKIQLKWPNDILINEQKVCGILIEKLGNNALFGIGCNLVNHPEIDIRFPATNLKDNEILIKPLTLMREILRYFDAILEYFSQYGFVNLVNYFNQNAFKINQAITIGQKNGLFLGVNTNGNALLKTSDAKIWDINFGDVE